MNILPPIITEQEFSDIGAGEEKIISKFLPFVKQHLHPFLNQLPCIQDIQKTRKKWLSRTRELEAFGNFATDSKHWYTFHNGGRNEAQFNIGLFATYLRIGLGFEFSRRKGGEPTRIDIVYACFLKFIRREKERFGRFVHDNSLEIEWCPRNLNKPEYIPTESVIDWLFNPKQEVDWIFIGRLLKRGIDARILENPLELSKVIETVFGGFRPIWEEAQIEASRIRY